MESDSNNTTWIAQELAKRLGDSIAGMAGMTPSVETVASPEPASSDWLWWRQPFSNLDEAILWLGAAPPAWLMVGTEALAGAGLDDASPEDCRGTYLELVQQAVSGLAGVLTAKAGREVLPEGGKEGPPPSSAYLTGITVEMEGSGTPQLFLVAISRNFGGSLAPKPTAAASSATQALSTVAAPSAGDSDRYELLLDVEMPVSVSFGRAHLPLREVVKLTSGAIVELNRAVSEPVELIINNCVIARGEVVVVDGNYGVRIKQIISRKERLRTLH
jgi:flagellar motor switch protein FliN